MKSRILLLLLALFLLSWGVDRGLAQAPGTEQEMKYRGGKLTTAERKEAAKRARAQGLQPGIAGSYKEADPGTEAVKKTRQRSTQVEGGEAVRKKR